MSTHDRPYYDTRRERDRDRERGFRDRDRGFGRRDEDDDRGSWMSRDPYDPRFRRDYRDRDPFDPREQEIQRGRHAFEPDFERRERPFGGERGRFEPFEDWERPREQQRESGSHGDYGPSSLPGYRGGYSGYEESDRSFSIGRSAWEQRGRESQRRPGRFAGRGPKGYQRSDERLKEEICDRLTAAADIDASELEVLVQSGEVTLQGAVPDRSMKRAAEDCVEEISGVQQVHNRLRIETRSFDEDDRDTERFTPKSSEGQRSSAGRKAH